MRDTGDAAGKMEALARSSFTIRFLSGPLHQWANTPTLLSLSAGATLLDDNDEGETKETKVQMKEGTNTRSNCRTLEDIKRGRGYYF